MALRRMRASVYAMKHGHHHQQQQQQRQQQHPAAAAAAAAAVTVPAAAMGHRGSGASVAVDVGLVIDGAALAIALQPQHEDELLALCKECAAVICCRVSPMQKAQVRRRGGGCALPVLQGRQAASQAGSHRAYLLLKLVIPVTQQWVFCHIVSQSDVISLWGFTKALFMFTTRGYICAAFMVVPLVRKVICTHAGCAINAERFRAL